MTVGSVMREVRKIKEAKDTIDRYNNGEISNILKTYTDEIYMLLENYEDILLKLKIADFK